MSGSINFGHLSGFIVGFLESFWRRSCSSFSGEEAASSLAGIADEHGRVVLLPFVTQAASLLDVWEASGAVL